MFKREIPTRWVKEEGKIAHRSSWVKTGLNSGRPRYLNLVKGCKVSLTVQLSFVLLVLSSARHHESGSR